MSSPDAFFESGKVLRVALLSSTRVLVARAYHVTWVEDSDVAEAALSHPLFMCQFICRRLEWKCGE